MTGQRSGDKRNFGGWILVSLYDRVRGTARAREITDTDALVEALTEWADRNETTGRPFRDATEAGTANREITVELRECTQTTQTTETTNGDQS